MRVTFDRIQVQAIVSLKCKRCGKKRRRTRVFWQTVNPFNAHDDGRQKTPAEVRASVALEASEWERVTDMCATCEAKS